MAEIASAYVGILPSARGFGTALNRQVGPQVSQAGVVAGKGFGRSLLKGFLAIGVVTQITRFVGDAFAEAREAQKVAALVDNAIKQTGGVANVTAAQVERLSDAFSRKTGIDDEQIATSAALLLTFKNVRDAGLGLENIFNRATRASADLSAAGFGSMDSAAKMLGKALNDPIKGLTALGRAGVTFTQAQQDQIKAMVIAGDLLGAQKVLLAEVESQVGGAAAATATDADKASVALGNLKEQIGTALLPGLNALARTFTNSIAPAISNFITNIQTGSGSTGRFAAFLRDDVLPVIRQYAEYVMTKVVPAMRDALVPVVENARKAFNSIRDSVRQNKPELTQLFNAFKKVAEFLQTKVIPLQLRLSANVLPALGVAIQVVISAAAFWVRAFNKVVDIVNTVRSGVNSAGKRFEAMKTAIETAAKGAKDAMVRNFRAALTPVLTLIATLDKALDKLNELRGKTSGGVKGTPVTGRAVPEAGRVGELFGRTFGDSVARGIESTSEKVSKATQKLIDNLKSKLENLKAEFASIKDAVASAFTGNLFEAETASEFITNLMGTSGQLQALKAAFKKLAGWGLKPEFLSQLFQSGNGGLILDLAAGTKEQAVEAGQLFGQVQGLSSSLGGQVADLKLGDKIDATNKRLDKLTKSVERVGEDVGRVINGAVRGGRRRARAA